MKTTEEPYTKEFIEKFIRLIFEDATEDGHVTATLCKKLMQVYADQQVNKVLDEAIQRVNNLKSLENFDLAEALYDQCLNMLRSLKIKQP